MKLQCSLQHVDDDCTTSDDFCRAINTLQVRRPGPFTLDHQPIRPPAALSLTPACPQVQSSIIQFWLGKWLGKKLTLLSHCTNHVQLASDVRVYLLLNLFSDALTDLSLNQDDEHIRH
jgi:hypothetical protein